MADIQEVMQRAIEAEQEAYDQYMKGRELVESQSAKDLLYTLAQEELQHKRKLEEHKSDIIEKEPDTQSIDLASLSLTPTNELNELKDILECAIKREEAERDCYQALKKSIDDQQLQDLFASLADEEDEHKRRVKEAFSTLFE